MSKKANFILKIGVEIRYLCVLKCEHEKEVNEMSKTLIKETIHIAIITAICGIIQILITIPISYFGYPAILGTALGCAVALLNFFFMGAILEKSVSRSKGASTLMGFGYIARLLMIGASVVWAIKVDYLNYICVIIPLIFPRIAIFALNIIRKDERKTNKDERT